MAAASSVGAFGSVEGTGEQVPWLGKANSLAAALRAGIEAANKWPVLSPAECQESLVRWKAQAEAQ